MKEYNRKDFKIGCNVDGFWIYCGDFNYLHHDGTIQQGATSCSLDKFEDGWYHTQEEAEYTLEKFLEDQKMSCKKAEQELFANMVKNCGIKVGDKVKVLYKCPDFHMGWGNRWIHAMDNCIGRTCTVDVINEKDGFHMKESWWFPPFVLEKIEEPVPTPKHGDICEYYGKKRIVLKIDGQFVSYDVRAIKTCGNSDDMENLYNGAYCTHYKVIGNVFENKC